MDSRLAECRAPGFHLRFRPLCAGVGECSVPCDAQGQVDLDQLGDRLLQDYFFARSLIGCRFSRPAVELDA